MTNLPNGLKSNPALDRWVGIDADGTLVIRSGKVELGQGIQTAMALIAASEFRVPVEGIRVTETGIDRAPNEGYTAGSFSVEAGDAAMRVAWDLAEPKEPGKGGVSAGADNGGDRNAIPLYVVGPRRVLHHELPQGPLGSSAMRSLGAHANIFAAEGFMDELAAEAGIDPVAFRLAHCDDAPAAAVIRAAAEAAGWDPAEPTGTGEGRGLGVARYKGSVAWYATVVRVRVEGDVRLVSVHGAVDAGHVIHRDGILNQIEGGVVQAASWTLKEAAHWGAGGGCYKILG